jgi:hypothetical protein
MKSELANMPAYPCSRNLPTGGEIYYSGLTIRQYYATEAMKSIINVYGKSYSAIDVEAKAFELADKMIKFEEKKNKPKEEE